MFYYFVQGHIINKQTICLHTSAAFIVLDQFMWVVKCSMQIVFVPETTHVELNSYANYNVHYLYTDMQMDSYQL